MGDQLDHPDHQDQTDHQHHQHHQAQQSASRPVSQPAQLHAAHRRSIKQYNADSTWTYEIQLDISSYRGEKQTLEHCKYAFDQMISVGVLLVAICRTKRVKDAFYWMHCWQTNNNHSNNMN